MNRNRKNHNPLGGTLRSDSFRELAHLRERLSSSEKKQQEARAKESESLMKNFAAELRKVETAEGPAVPSVAQNTKATVDQKIENHFNLITARIATQDIPGAVKLVEKMANHLRSRPAIAGKLVKFANNMMGYRDLQLVTKGKSSLDKEDLRTINNSLSKVISEVRFEVDQVINSVASIPITDLGRFEHHKQKLEGLVSSKGWAIGKVPIVLIANLDVDKLQRMMGASTFEGSYPILEQQTIIGVAAWFANQQGFNALNDKEFKKMELRQEKNPTKSIVDVKEELKENINELLDSLNSRYPGKKFRIVGNIRSWFKSGWVWVPTEETVNLLHKCAKGPLKIDKWDLAFASTPFQTPTVPSK